VNKESQKRHIVKFLERKIGSDVDTFCIYQWIERCHFHKWWDLAVELAAHLPPNSLDRDYDMRLNFILKECHDRTSTSVTQSLPREPRTILVRPKRHVDTQNRDRDLTGTVVLGFQFEGKRHRAMSHKDVFVKIVHLAFERYPDAKERVFSLSGNKRRYFSLNRKDLSPQSELIAGTHIWVELQQNANTLYRLGKEVLRLFGMDTWSFEIITANVLEKPDE